MKGAFSTPVVQEGRQMAHPALTRAFLQAAVTAAMHCQPERYTHPPLCLTLSASAEHIFKMDAINPLNCLIIIIP